MKVLEKSIKNRYILFVSTFILIILAMFFIVQHSINLQISDAHLINVSGRQRMLSQNISKLAYAINYSNSIGENTNRVKTLDSLLTEWESKHEYLQIYNENKWKNTSIDSLLKVNETYQEKIFNAGKNIVIKYTSGNIDVDVSKISLLEGDYLNNTDILVYEYQKATEEHLKELKLIIYLFVIISFLILFIEFVFIFNPGLKQIFQRNKELLKSNDSLSISEKKLKLSMLKLTKLKSELESSDFFYKTFIEQIPTAIAMLDNNLCYLAVSRTWIKDYKLEGKDVIGKSHYDVFPEIGEDWKEKNKKCLKGAIDKCDEAPFVREDGTTQWIHWDTRPWYKSDGSIGGLVMHTGDITKIKENESKKKRIEGILKKTNQLARIGAWEVDLINNNSYLSDVVKDIYGIPSDFEISAEKGLEYYKEGESRDAIEKAIKETIENGTPYDLEVELINAKGEVIWIRTTGQAELIDGKCVKIYGLFQDINNIKLAQLALHKTHSELKAIFNSNAVAIIATDLDGVINQFNLGAEIITGYTAAEVIGIEKPINFHLKEEYDNFKKDIAEFYGKNPVGFSPQLEMSLHNAYDTREWNYVRKDGTLIPVQLTLTSVKDENNVHIGYLGVSTDISERKKNQNKLLRKNQILNFAEEITLMGNWQVDIASNKVKWSNNLFKLTGIEKTTETTTSTYLNITHPEDRQRVNNNMKRSIEEKVFTDIIHRIQLADGTIKIVQLLGQVIKDDLGNVVEMIGTCQDVTAQKLAETDLLRKNYILNFAERITQIGNWQWDVVTDTLKWSSNLYKIYEYDENIKDLNYDTFFSQVHPDDKDYITGYVENSFIEKKFPNNFIHRIVTRSGKIKTVHYLGEVILNDQGEVIEMMGACQDITEQKMEENKFRGLLESAPDAMVIVDEAGKIQLINKQSEKLFGYSSEELIDQSVEILIPSQLNHNHYLDHNGLFSSPSNEQMGVDKTKELVAKHKNGNEIPIQISLSPLKTEEGILVSAAIRDITVQKLAQKKILDAKQDLEVLAQKLMIQNEHLADFAQITSHNLRAPVSNLNSLLGLYIDSNDHDEKQLLFQKFESVIKHLTFTLNTLVEAIKIRGDKSRPKENIRFIDVLDKTKELLSGEIIETNAVITSDFSKVSNINYNKIYLESIFLNLVNNAIKYKSKDRTPVIKIETELFEGRTKLTISDNGLGINLNRHGDKIFGLNKVFHRHPEARGVGLYMTKTQIEAMDGEISVVSKINEGSIFTVIF
jgi:PAS domain S-box-containing protein